MGSFLFILDITGTIAFAISGAMAAIRKKLDLFGVIVLATATATGGGIIRDTMIGNIPPLALTQSIYFLIPVFCGLIVFILYKKIHRIERLIFFFDAVGLGVFTVTGIRMGLNCGIGSISLLFLGLITGIGGGIIRDILAGQIPFVLRKDLYASLSLAGGLAYILSRKILPDDLAALLSIIVIIVLRILARKFHWELPIRHDYSEVTSNTTIQKNKKNTRETKKEGI